MSNIAIYPKGTSDFFSQGLGILSDVISSNLTQTATSSGNVQQQLVVEYPLGGHLVEQLIEGNFIRASTSAVEADYGIYEIDETLKSDDGLITVYASPYANRILRMTFDNGGRFSSFPSVQLALDEARRNITGFPSNFTLTSGISKSVDLSKENYPTFGDFLEALNHAVSGNIKYRLFGIQIYSSLGVDIQTPLRDDMNTSSVKIKTDYSNIINKVIPLLPVHDESGNATQDKRVGTIVTSKYANSFLDYWAGKVIDFETQEEANTYFDRTSADRPVHTVEVEPINTEMAAVELFDIVQLYSSRFDYTDKLRVSERVFDTLTETVTKFSLGSSSVNIVNSIIDQSSETLATAIRETISLISANGKGIDSWGAVPPANPHEGDTWFFDDGVNSGVKTFVNGDWVLLVDLATPENIRTAVVKSLEDARTTSEQIAADLDTKIQGQLTTVNGAMQTINGNLTTLDGKAQAYANKALSDAKADTQVQITASLATSQAALDAAKTDLTKSITDETNARVKAVSDLDTKAKNYTDAAKTDLIKSIADETAARTQAVFAVDTKAQGYATTAKNDAITAATTADGVINKRIDDSVDSITSTISQNKADADGKITTAQTTATQALNGLSTKVDTTTYNAKTNQLTTDLNTTTTTANKAATDIVSIKSDNVKQDARMLTIEQTADGQKTTISSIQTTQGQMNGSIATLQSRADGFEATVTKVENMGGINQLFNTEFSPDFAGWYAGSSTQTGKFQRGTVIDSSQGWFIGYGKHNGSNVLKKTLGVGWNATYSDLIPVGETSILTATIEAQSTSDYNGSVTAAIYLRFYDGSQNYISTLSKDTTRVMSWGRHISTVTVPTGAVYVSFNLLTNGSAGVNYYSQPMLSFTDTPMDYVIGNYNNNQAVSKAQLTADNATISINNYKTDADGRISKAQADIVVNTNAIATKVSQTVYDAKTGQLQTDLNTTTTTANKATTEIASIKTDNTKRDARILTIEQTAEGQKTTISNLTTELGKTNGSVATLISRADGFEATVTKVNNLQIGGTNLIPKGNIVTTSSTQISYDSINDIRTITIANGAGGYWGAGLQNNAVTRHEIPWGKSYTYSVEIKPSVEGLTWNTDVNTLPYGDASWNGNDNDNTSLRNTNSSMGGGAGAKLIPNVWNKVWATFINSDSRNINKVSLYDNSTIGIVNNTGNTVTVLFRHFKGESGNLPTDWSPAPEDVDSATAKAQLTADNAALAISNYKTDADGRISKAQADITVTANEVKTKVSQTDYNTKTADLTTKVNTAQSTADGAVTTIGAYKTSNDGRISTAESKISQNTSAIALRVLKTDYDSNNNTINGKFAAIDVTTDKITQSVSDVTNKVNAMGQINQLFNTEFSPDFAGWGYWDVDMKKSTSNITNSRLVISNRYKGSNKILTDSSIDARYVTSTIPISISSNQPMVARVTADSDEAGSTLRLHISFHDVNGIQTGNVNTVGNLTTTSQDIVVAFNGPLPANTVSAYLVVMVVGKAAWAQPMVIYGDTIGAYTPGAYNSTQKIAAQQITIDSITNIVSNPTTGLSKRVQTAEGTLSQVTGADIPALQKATYWQPYGSLDFNSYTKQGSFFFNSTAAKPNGPTSSTAWTYLMVEQGTADNGRIKQTAWYDGVTGVKITYVRTLNSGTWSPWYANDNDSVTTISQTNEAIRTEINNRQTGDNNTLTSAKNFTTSSISSATEGLNSTITQTASGILAQVNAINMVTNSEFDPTNEGWYTIGTTAGSVLGVKDAIGTTTMSFGDWTAVGGSTVMTYNKSTWYSSEPRQIHGGDYYSASIVVGRTNLNSSIAFDLRIAWFDSNKKLIGYASAGNPVNTASYTGAQRYTLENQMSPSEAAYASLVIAHSGTPSGGSDYISRPMLNIGSTVGTYSPTYGSTYTSTQLALLKDNWSIGITSNTGAIASGIAADPNAMNIVSPKVIISSPQTQITGTAWIKTAMIADGQISTAKIGDASITSAKILSLDVDKLTGNISNFLQSNWNGVYKSTSMNANGMTISTSDTRTEFGANGSNYFSNSGVRATYAFGKWSDSNGRATSSTGLYLGATGSENSFINILGTNGAAALVLAGSAMDRGANLNIMNGTLNSFVNFNVRTQLHFKGNIYNSPSYIEINESNRTFNFFTGGGSQGGGDYFYFNQKVISAGTFSSTSVLSKKNIIGAYEEDALGEIVKTQLVNFTYKNRPDEVQVSPIIDDVNTDKEYYIPNTILGQDGEYVDMYSMASMSWKAIQQLNEKIKQLNEEIRQLKGEPAT